MKKEEQEKKKKKEEKQKERKRSLGIIYLRNKTEVWRVKNKKN